MKEKTELIISIVAIVLSIISIIYQFFRNRALDKKEKREKDLERCVLHYRDEIRKKLDSIKEEYQKYTEDIDLRKNIDPFFRETKYYVHDIKFFDKKYNTDYYEKINRKLLECQTVIYQKIGDPDSYINEIKEIIITAE